MNSPPLLSQVECGAWVAADVALFRLVPAQSKVDDTRAELLGVAVQRSAGGRLPAENAGDAEVRKWRHVASTVSIDRHAE